MPKNNFASIESIINVAKKGGMFILVDDEKRENEGDLIISTSNSNAKNINFMAKYGRGLICLALDSIQAKRLNLSLMSSNNQSRNKTAFTISIEAKKGITTGISAKDRAKTISIASKKNVKKSDIVSPGHVFPIIAKDGGVLVRAGHTEAGCDLARLAGFEPAATIVEILNEDGSMARRPDLEEFSRKHDIKIGTIADLIRYRLEKERFVERIAKKVVNTDYGEFTLYCYDDQVSQSVHVAMVKGVLKKEQAPLVRVHIQDTLGDVLGVQATALGWPVTDAIRRISEEETGIVIILREQESSRDLMDAVEELSTKNDQLKEQRISDAGLRTYGVGAQILRDLGVSKMRVLSAPKQMYAISGFDLNITEYVEQ